MYGALPDDINKILGTNGRVLVYACSIIDNQIYFLFILCQYFEFLGTIPETP